MFNFFDKIRLMGTYGSELESILKDKRKELESIAAKQEFDRTKDHLQLCFKHQQEERHSHYGEKNCNYRQLLAKLKLLEG